MNRPRVLFVGRTRYRLPLDASVAKKFDALSRELDVHVLAAAATGSRGSDPMFTLVPPLPLADGLAFWLMLPWRTARLLRARCPDAVVCQTAYDAFAVLVARRIARVHAKVVVEVHADWRTSTRLYGSRSRRLLGGIGDALAAWALRHADAVRPVSPFTAGLVRDLGVEPAESFPAFMDLAPFEGDVVALPEQPRAVFIGVLERYKAFDTLVRAWGIASARVPAATLHVVGDGTLRELTAGLEWSRRLSSAEVAAALDASWVLVLPSRSEGMGRVLVEAFCRGRGVVGSRAGSIPNLVEDGASGLLVDAGDDAEALADALVRVLSDRELAERLGAGARAAAGPWLQTPDEYARRVRELVE